MRSPKWTRDELILSLDLYFRIDPIRDREKHPEVIALSNLLRSFATSALVADPRYRSAQSVHAKLQNFMRLDPTRNIAGLPSGGRADEMVWAEFAGDRERLRAAAQAIIHNPERNGNTADESRFWIVLTFGDDRRYGGNEGYEDETERLYRYDNFVAIADVLQSAM